MSAMTAMLEHTPSQTTQQLMQLIQQRDAMGQRKYNASLDRTDLSLADWLQHMIEELADGAGYGLAALRVIEQCFQRRAQQWVEATFPHEIVIDMTERGDRLLEETLELLQSHGYERNRIATLASYVYNRPIGEPAQEAGGVMLTLAAYCSTAGLDMAAAGEAELARVSTPEVTARVQAKQLTKAGIAFPTDMRGFDRARETSRRQSAVELLLSMGWVWNDQAWQAPTVPIQYAPRAVAFNAPSPATLSEMETVAPAMQVPFAYVDVSETSADLTFPRDPHEGREALRGLPLGLHPLYLIAPAAEAPFEPCGYVCPSCGRDYQSGQKASDALQSMLASTPAAPGIDLLHQAADVIRELQQCVNAGRSAGKLNTHAADVLARIDASPKGGSTDAKDAARYRFLVRNWQFDKEDCSVFIHCDADGIDDTHKLDHQVDAAMQATSAEVGE